MATTLLNINQENKWDHVHDYCLPEGFGEDDGIVGDLAGANTVGSA